MKLSVVPGSPNCRKVQMLAHELGCDLEVHVADFDAGELKRPEFMRKNPNGMVPVLTLEDGRTLWESNAIMQLLADRHGDTPLWPADPFARADVSRWQCWELAHFGNHLGAALYARLISRLIGEPSDEAQAQAALARWAPFAAVLEAQLATRAFITGAAPTLADFSLVSQLPLCDLGGVDLSPYPAMRGWLGRMAERQSFHVTQPPEALLAALRAVRAA